MGGIAYKHAHRPQEQRVAIFIYRERLVHAAVVSSLAHRIGDAIGKITSSHPNPAAARKVSVSIDGGCEVVGVGSLEPGLDFRVPLLQFSERSLEVVGDELESVVQELILLLVCKLLLDP